LAHETALPVTTAVLPLGKALNPQLLPSYCNMPTFPALEQTLADSLDG